MSAIFEHIDAIARKKRRDVLFIEFYRVDAKGKRGCLVAGFDWPRLTMRQQIIEWLDKRRIEWEPCSHAEVPALIMSYRGQIYIDLPFDRGVSAYRELEAFFGKPNGKMRVSGVRLCRLRYTAALRNADQYGADYWDRW
ncbi:hypothetical protein [Paraburkholderia sp. Ac-20347]|uniref:hypothetical protein n=1 Tax=Paraburkholderia sp. Ac-20347 TaxID=2703892 RepID=UPI001980ADE8|nr:hypothetical protein [Paraburkholderia sp. Ac-20347]MBN3813352.1 hypothetical protein [Paraburkholderia sp. Ac-20347]